jgi:dsDNA-specific endonuclease/ATPase MutS2
MSKFKIGDAVSLIDEHLNGIITAIIDQKANVLLEDGFAEWISFYKLVHRNTNQLEIEPQSDKHADSFVETRPERVHEIDLHIESLVIEWQKIPTEKILERQITSFSEELNYAIKNRYDKLIVIHGKGKGILKSEIYTRLHAKGLKYSDMNHGNYKGSAVEILLAQ